MTHSNTKGIILKRVNYGEADRILTVITPDMGKLSILAKGVRRSKSKLAGGLELFSVTHLGYINGKSELKTVTSTQLEQYYGNITDNIEVTMLAYEFLKLIDQLTQDSCDADYFDLLVNGLESLNDHVDHPDVVYVWFVSSLLAMHGTGFNLEQQTTGAAFDETSLYHFSYDDMGFFAHQAGTFTPKHIKFLRLLRKVSKPANLIKIDRSRELAREIRPMLSTCLKMTH